MSDIISAGKALDWGTSEWSADEIRAAIDIADRHHLHRPVTEQSQYHPRTHQGRERVRPDQRRVQLRQHDLEPLASGLLTGKYRDGIPEDSRVALRGLRLARRPVERRRGDRPRREAPPIADRLGCTMAQLALAWCTKNPHVSTVITGASKVSQVEQNFGALDVIPLLTDEVNEEMEAAVDAHGLLAAASSQSTACVATRCACGPRTSGSPTPDQSDARSVRQRCAIGGDDRRRHRQWAGRSSAGDQPSVGGDAERAVRGRAHGGTKTPSAVMNGSSRETNRDRPPNE